MKLKKLIPLASIASVGAIVTPLVTSCAKNAQIKWEYTYEKGSEITKYEPKFSPTTETIDSVEKAKQVYFNELDKNHKLYVDDLLCNINIEIDAEIENLKYDSMNGTVSINLTKFDKESKEVDFSMSSEFEIKGKEPETQYPVEANGVRKFAFHKIPLDVVDSNNQMWSVCPTWATSQIKNIYQFLWGDSPTVTYDEIKNYLSVNGGLDKNKDWYITYSDSVNCKHVTHSNTAKWTYENYIEPVSRETIFGEFTPTNAVDVIIEFAALGLESHFLNKK